MKGRIGEKRVGWSESSFFAKRSTVSNCANFIGPLNCAYIDPATGKTSG